NGASISSVELQIAKASDLSVVYFDQPLGVVKTASVPMSSYDAKVRYRWRNDYRAGGSDGWSAWSPYADAPGTGSAPPPPPPPPPPDDDPGGRPRRESL